MSGTASALGRLRLGARTSLGRGSSGRGIRAPGTALRGDRALAVRVIGETGARAARRSFAAAVHPPSPPPRIRLPLERVPGDVVRRGARRLDRVVVRRFGRLLLALRRVDSTEAVRQLHQLDHVCFGMEQRIASLEDERSTHGDS